MYEITSLDRKYLSYSSIGTTVDEYEQPELPPPTYSVVEYTSFRVDQGPLPGYKRLIRSGLNATTELYGEKRKLEVEEGGFSANFLPPNLFDPFWFWTRAQGDLCGSFSPNPVSINLENAHNMAKMKFINKCNSAISALDGQVFVGELGETLRMIKRPMSAFRNGIDDYFDRLRRHRNKSKNYKRKLIAETWLEYKFGWAPLIHDIEDGWEALQRLSRDPQRFKPVQASGTDALDFSPGPLQVDNGVVSYLIDRIYTANAVVKYSGAVDLQMGGRAVVVKGQLGFHINRFVPTLWELIPYSFLVDYFSNVGDIISSWAFGTSSLRWAYYGERVQTDYKLSVSDYRMNPGLDSSGTFRLVSAKPCKSRGSHVSVHRYPSVGSLMPTFRLEIPGMASTKWLNIAALTQSRKSLRPF